MTTAIAERRADLNLPGDVSEVGYVLPEDLSFEEWQQIGGTLRHLGKSVMWWIGDWLRYGERKYGETYAQAVDATGYDYQTIRDAVWVANKVELSDRNDSLTWTHHRQVAQLEHAEQVALLTEAAERGWTVQDLRGAVKQRNVPTVDPVEPTAPAADVSHADHRQSCYAQVTIGYSAALASDVEVTEVYEGPDSHTRERTNKRYEWHSPRMYLIQRAPQSAVEAKKLADEIAQQLVAEMMRVPLLSMMRR